MPAIRIEDATGARVRGVKISGFDVGIQARNSDFTAEDVSFDNVRQPWDIDGGAANVSGTRITRDPKIAAGPNKSFKGWCPSSGPSMPAQCPRCETIFPSRNYKISQSRFWSRDNAETCPLCRYEHARVADGIFDITDEALRFLAGPETSTDVMEHIGKIMKLLAQEDITPEQAISDVEKVSSPFAGFLRRALQIGVSAVIFLAAAVTIEAYVYHRHGIDVFDVVWTELSATTVILREQFVAIGPQQSGEGAPGAPADRQAPPEPDAIEF